MISKTWAQHEFYERISSVPLTYHYSTTIQKTSRKQRARPYLSSTTIVPLFWYDDPYLSLSENENYIYIPDTTNMKIMLPTYHFWKQHVE